MKKIIGIFFAVAVILVILLLPGSGTQKQGSVCVKENCFTVEIAKTFAQQQLGLMNRQSLDGGKGMLFIFGKEDIYPFWMKNTLIPLDIIWIDENKNIVFIKEKAEPCKTASCPFIIPLAKAKYVLEINAGLVKEYGFVVGDRVRWYNIDNPAREKGRFAFY